MNKEIGRKLTSLTLLSILLASGVTFAIPGALPAAEASHNANLFVSAENSLFSNYFGGPMVVEIVVNDPALTDTDEAKGEPDVTVNGKDVRMVQATDGLWYAYIADQATANLADSLAARGADGLPVATGAAHADDPGQGLDFGTFCTNVVDIDNDVQTIVLTDTVGIAIPRMTTGTAAGSQGIEAAAACGDTSAVAALTAAAAPGTNNVVREFKTPTAAVAPVALGQIGLFNAAVWPFIQLYNFNPTGNVEIKYNKGGGAQTTVLTFDTMDTFSKLSLDRGSYPPGAQVHTNITDGQLNIDPTDEDSWTFGTANAGGFTPQTRYQLFTENGATAGDIAGGSPDIIAFLGAGLMFEDNGQVILNPVVAGPAAIVDLDANNDQLGAAPGSFVDGTVATSATTLIVAGNQPMTFVESGSNTGIFTNYDEADDANLDILPGAARGTSASINYNKVGTTILVSLAFGTIDISVGDEEWNSGEEVPVTLTDQDQNFNSRADEDLDVFAPGVTIIPSLRIGNPYTLAVPVTNAIGSVPFFTTTVAAPAGAPAFTFTNTGVAAAAYPAGSTGVSALGFGAFPGALTLAAGVAVDRFSDIERDTWPLVTVPDLAADAVDNELGTVLVIDLGTDLEELRSRLVNVPGTGQGFNMLNYDLRGITTQLTGGARVTNFDFYLLIDGAGVGPAVGFPNDAFTPGAAAFVAVPLAFDQTTPSGIIDITTSASTACGVACGPLVNPSLLAPVVAAASLDGVIFAGTTPGAAGTGATVDKDDAVALMVVFDVVSVATTIPAGTITPITVDWLAFGTTLDGTKTTERINNSIYRFELEESGDNTGTFVGTAEYTMLSQTNIFAAGTYTGLRTVDDEVTFVVHDDLDDEDAPRINYLDLGADGVATQIADQQDAPTHSAVVSFDKDNYKTADTVTVTLEDQDLNVDSDLIDIYVVVPTVATGTAAQAAVAASDPSAETVGVNLAAGADAAIGTADDTATAAAAAYNDGTPRGRLLDVTFDDERWAESDTDFTADGLTDCPDLEIANTAAFDDGLGDAGFTLVETGAATGVFKGDFQIPTFYCSRNAIAAGAAFGGGLDTPTTTGTDIEANYVDFRDASGETIEVGDGAGVRANTGSISLDRTVYPTPFGSAADSLAPGGAGAALPATPTAASYFPVHATAVAIAVVGPPAGAAGVDNPIPAGARQETLPEGETAIHVRVNDPDFDISATGEDRIGQVNPAALNGGGPVQIVITRGSVSVTLATAGAVAPVAGLITAGAAPVATLAGVDLALGTADDLFGTRELGPMLEIAPNAGIFEIDLDIEHTDGPSDAKCPVTLSYDVLIARAQVGVVGGGVLQAGPIAGVNAEDRFLDQVGGPVAGLPAGVTGNHCIIQGDILTVQYTDPTDSTGNINTVTDSATFDLRNGVLQSDKSVYIIGSDMILTLIEPDFDLDSDSAETYTLDLIEWSSDAADVTMGPLANALFAGTAAAFDPEPSAFRETGDNTGIFQVVIEIPNTLGGARLDRGEEIELEYTDWGPSGADFVGDEDEDINLTVYTSNFGATVELDQKVYTWTDKVFITVVAPDHNFDSNLIDEIGNTNIDKITVATRGQKLNTYQLEETGTDTGIFTGEVTLIGFCHDADGDTTTGAAAGAACAVGSDVFGGVPVPANGGGPTNGFLPSGDDDGLTVSFEFTEDETVVGSALVRWNIGEVQFLEASYPATGQGVVRVVDPDMNWNPEAVDNYDIDVWSDSDAGGIDLTMTETNEATGIFEGTVFFTVTEESSGHRLRVAEGDTVTAEYEDNTLPSPYTTADELEIAGTSFIGTIVPPLERAPASNPRVVDSFGNELDEVSVDQQVQIAADLVNGQDRDQPFAYLVQISKDGVTYSLSWITGSLAPGQSLNPAQSWTPTESGTYDVQIFVWESVDNPDALSPPVETTISVV